MEIYHVCPFSVVVVHLKMNNTSMKEQSLISTMAFGNDESVIASVRICISKLVRQRDGYLIIVRME